MPLNMIMMGETIRHKWINSRLTTSDSGEYICLFDVFGFFKLQMPKDSISLSVQKKYLQQSGRGIGNIDFLFFNPVVKHYCLHQRCKSKPRLKTRMIGVRFVNA